MLTNSVVNTGCSNPHFFQIDYKQVVRGSYRLLARLLLGLFSTVALADSHHFSDAACQIRDYDAEARIKQVIDGDTVILSDDRHIRLIGINTPEIDHDGDGTQAGAETAREYLSRLLRPGTVVYLVYDEERKDRYQRTLAHLFLQSGINIQALMLSRGLATTLTIPPNLSFLDCYVNSNRIARTHRIGLWALKQYQPLPATSITRNSLGFRSITGVVSRVGKSRSTVWINIDRDFAIRITNEDLIYFDIGKLDDLVGKPVLAQGWLYHLNGEYRMRIRHPVDLVELADRN